MDEIVKKIRITGSKKFNLADHDSSFSGDYKKEDADEILSEYKAEMEQLQDKLYATHQYSLLIILQAMDAAGKDSAIEHVMSGLNPQGCQVYSFKQPSTEEYDHDFLWRHARALPESGRIGIHNRSHYENVLVTKVHQELIANEHLPKKYNAESLGEEFWENRYESIRDFEKHLFRNGTIILKFFLNVSKDEQKKRFLERIDDPLKNWKFSSRDVEERKYWSEYMSAYQDAIRATACEHAPWYIIPADKKWFTRIAMSKIIVDTLQSLNLKLPALAAEELAALDNCKKHLLAE